MLSIVPREIIDIILSLLLITDKRNMIRCNQELNSKTSLMVHYENEFMCYVNTKYYYLPKKLSKLELYTLEIIHDNYEHLMPDKYICKKNKLCADVPCMYFYCAVNKNINL